MHLVNEMGEEKHSTLEGKKHGSANGNRTRISALKGPRANRCTIAPQWGHYNPSIIREYGSTRHARLALGCTP